MRLTVGPERMDRACGSGCWVGGRLETGPFGAFEGQPPYHRRESQGEMGPHLVARWAWRKVVCQEVAQKADDEPNGCSGRPGGRTHRGRQDAFHCLELTVTGRVGRRSVFGQRKRAAYMVMLGEDIESRCSPPVVERSSVPRRLAPFPALAQGWAPTRTITRWRAGVCSSGPSAYPTLRP